MGSEWAAGATCTHIPQIAHLHNPKKNPGEGGCSQARGVRTSLLLSTMLLLAMIEILPVKGSCGLLLLPGNTKACSHWSQTINGYKWANEENKAKLLFYHPSLELIQDLHGLLSAKGRAVVTTRDGKREILSPLWFFFCSLVFAEPVSPVPGVEGCTYTHIHHQWFSAPSSSLIRHGMSQSKFRSTAWTSCSVSTTSSLQHSDRLRQRITGNRELVKGVNITRFLEPEGCCVTSGYKLQREVELCRRRGVCASREWRDTVENQLMKVTAFNSNYGRAARTEPHDNCNHVRPLLQQTEKELFLLIKHAWMFNIWRLIAKFILFDLAKKANKPCH